MSRALYWDIDGTLLDMPRKAPSRHALAVEIVVGRLPSALPGAGKTDYQILSEMAASLGLGAPTHSEVVHLALAELGDITVRDLVSDPATLRPGCIYALRRAQEIGWVNRVATGNMRRRAVAKLESVGIDNEFDLANSLFGDTAGSRFELVSQIGQVGDVLSVTVGDTELDIRASRASRVPCIGVNESAESRTLFHDLGADLVIADLEVGKGAMLDYLRTKYVPQT